MRGNGREEELFVNELVLEIAAADCGIGASRAPSLDSREDCERGSSWSLRRQRFAIRHEQLCIAEDSQWIWAVILVSGGWWGQSQSRGKQRSRSAGLLSTTTATCCKREALNMDMAISKFLRLDYLFSMHTWHSCSGRPPRYNVLRESMGSVINPQFSCLRSA